MCEITETNSSTLSKQPQGIFTVQRHLLHDGSNSVNSDKRMFVDHMYKLYVMCAIVHYCTLRKDFVILQLYLWLLSSTKHCSWNVA